MGSRPLGRKARPWAAVGEETSSKRHFENKYLKRPPPRKARKGATAKVETRRVVETGWFRVLQVVWFFLLIVDSKTNLSDFTARANMKTTIVIVLDQP